MRADTIHLINALRYAGITCQVIAYYLNHEGHTTEEGKHFNNAEVLLAILPTLHDHPSIVESELTGENLLMEVLGFVETRLKLLTKSEREVFWEEYDQLPYLLFDIGSIPLRCRRDDEFQEKRKISQELKEAQEKNSRRSRPENKERNDQIRIDREAGMTLGELAQKYRTSVDAIRGVLKRGKPNEKMNEGNDPYANLSQADRERLEELARQIRRCMRGDGDSSEKTMDE